MELMILIAVIGIVSAVGVPSFKAMLVTSEVVDTTNELMITLKRARSEAISRGRDVTVCSSTDGQTCSGVAGNWINGWLIYDDANGNGAVDEAAGELVWVKEMDSKTRLTITPTDPSFAIEVEFSYTGVLANGIAGGFHVCSGYGAADGYPRREISVSVSGDPQFVKNTAVRC